MDTFLGAVFLMAANLGNKGNTAVVGVPVERARILPHGFCHSFRNLSKIFLCSSWKQQSLETCLFTGSSMFGCGPAPAIFAFVYSMLK